jgi:peroxiredoxin
MNKFKASIAGMMAAWVLGGAVAAPAATTLGQVGTSAYAFAGLKGLDGKTYSLMDLRGKVVLMFVMQYNCGGCKANAPTVGQLAGKFQDKAFQAVAPEVNKGTDPQLHTFDASLRSKAPSISFPILSGIPDSQIVSSGSGAVWKNYNSLRDVFFVIDDKGMIVERQDGNRSNSMPAANFTKLETAITKALAAIPTVTLPRKSLRADAAGQSIAGMNIFDLRGRNLTNLGRAPATLVVSQGILTAR